MPLGDAPAALRCLDPGKPTSDLSATVDPIIANPDQMAIIREVQALDARFGADKTLFHSLSAIDEARG